MDLKSVILTTSGSVGFFKLVNCGLNNLPAPESARRNVWKWRNISTSLVHSLITGLWAVLCFYVHPQMAEDLIATHSVFSYALVCVSIGYFIYDFLDMVQNQKLSQSWELLFHHVVVVTCLGIACEDGSTWVRLVGRLREINWCSCTWVVLLGGAGRNAYGVNSLVNLGTYVVFEISTLRVDAVLARV
ncbi:TLC domain-containing protein 2-like [Anguilla rostrata]|uniref:TLC domain-containing protein 2-like n=1 Tax=Anguilla rostrata TaxID=7938 RepID=UPI0030CAD815